jgi:hypothetical protein
MSDIKTGQELAADSAIETAVATMLSTFSTNKVSDLGAVLDRVGALRVLTKRMIRKNTTNAVRPRSASLA